MNLPHRFSSAWKISRSAPFSFVNILPRVFLASSSRCPTPINLFLHASLLLLLNAAPAFCFPVFPSCFLLSQLLGTSPQSVCDASSPSHYASLAKARGLDRASLTLTAL
jgi:hypothetical protein